LYPPPDLVGIECLRQPEPGEPELDENVIDFVFGQNFGEFLQSVPEMGWERVIVGPVGGIETGTVLALHEVEEAEHPITPAGFVVLEGGEKFFPAHEEAFLADSSGSASCGHLKFSRMN